MSSWLIDTMLYTGLLIALVLALRRPVGRFFGPQFAYALWGLPFLRLLMPPIVLPASLRPAPEIVAPVAIPAEWIDPAPAALVPYESPLPIADAAIAWETPSFAQVSLSVWIVGALVFLAWRVLTYQRMRRALLAKARPVGEVGRVRLIETPALAAPVAFGVLDKVIALPPLFMAQPDIGARDLAIAHELAHHRGHDLAANFAAQALLALHWFNPLAWIGWRAMRRDQEAACDARVVAGRGREDRVRYAAVIAGAAAGPRLALAAPMACPMLGDKSIIHRLRSLAMSETSVRRRWLGRMLVAAGAFAVPLTASISYARITEPTVAPATPGRSLPASQEEPSRDGSQATQAVVRQGREHGAQPEAHGGPSTGSPVVRFEFPWGEPGDPDFDEKMEAYGRQMEEWGEEYGRQMEQWGEQLGARFEAQAEAPSRAGAARAEAQARRAEAAAEAQASRVESQARRAQAQAWANAVRYTPEVVQSCDENERRRTTTADGRPRVVICASETREIARSSLRFARESIAHNPEMSDAVRSEVLADLDEEIERIEHDQE